MAIAFDSSAQVAFGTGTSRTLSHTCGSLTNGYLVTFVRINNDSDVITGVTYAGVSMTQLYKFHETGAGNNNAYVYIYGLASPTSGANNIVASFSSSVTIALFSHSYSGVISVGQPDATSSNAATATSVTVTTTPVTSNSWIVAQARSYNPGAGETASTNVTARTTRVDGGISGDYGPTNPVAAIGQVFNAGSGYFSAVSVALRPTLDSGLVSYYPLSDTSDSVGSNTATNIGTATFTTGKIGNALTLNGSSQALTVGTSLLSAYSACTIASWFKLGATGAYQRIVSKTDDTTYNQLVRVTNGNKLAAHISTSSESTITGGTTLSSGVYYFGVVTYDGSNINLYLNGVSDATAVAKTGSLKTSADIVSIGRDNQGATSEYFNGQIDEIGIWSRALTADEISQLYNSNRALAYPLTAPTLYGGVAYWKLDESSGNAADSVGSNTGTNTDVTYDTGKINNAGVFNGSSSKFVLPNLNVSGSSARSISCWIKPDVVNSLDTIFASGVSATMNNFDLFIGQSTGSVYLSFNGGDVGTGNVLTAGNYYHIVAVFDGGVQSLSTCHIYLNGVEQSLTQYGTSGQTVNTTNSNYAIGTDPVTAGRYFDGQIDEACIFNRALSSTEVTELYNSGAGKQYPWASVISAISNFFHFF